MGFDGSRFLCEPSVVHALRWVTFFVSSQAVYLLFISRFRLFSKRFLHVAVAVF